MNNCIIVPIYKNMLDEYEQISLNRVFNSFLSESIFIVCPNGFEPKFNVKNAKLVFFDKKYFSSIRFYNKLLLSSEFYETFQKFDYLLIHQLDAYCFQNDLNYWASLDYDYIGGICKQEGSDEFMPINGGFSLRKISTFIKVLKPLDKIPFPMEVRSVLLKAIYKRILLFISIFLKGMNKDKFLFRGNEDMFIFSFLHKKYNIITVPTYDQAKLFAWDTHPSELYKKMKTLPFGSHAWFRSDRPYEGNFGFWKPFIID